MLWNYQDLLDILEREEVRDVVAAVISGHQHDGGVFTSEFGTHYVVMESPIVAEPGHNGPFAVVQAFDDSLKFVGFGKGKESSLFPGVAEKKESDGGEKQTPLTRELLLRPLAKKNGEGA